MTKEKLIEIISTNTPDEASNQILKLIENVPVIKSLPPDWCWVKAKIVEDGDHMNDGKAMIVSVPRIDDPSREAIIWIWKYNVWNGNV